MFFKPKTAKSDFTEEMLPHNRRQVFFDVVKLHFWKLLLLGFIVFLFSLPAHIYSISQNMYEAAIRQSYESVLLNGTVDEVRQAQIEINNAIVSFSNTKALVNIVLYMFLAVGLSAVGRTIRRFAFGENVYLRHDLPTGIKENSVQFVLIALFAGIAAFLCNYIYNQSLSAYIVTGKIHYTWIGIIPAAVISVILVPAAMYSAVSITVYSNKFRQNVRIGFILYLSRIWKTVLAVICCLLIYAVQYIPLPYFNIIGRILSSILTPFVMLGWQLFAMNGLDKKINSKFYPDMVGKGVYKTQPEKTETQNEQDASEEAIIENNKEDSSDD